MNLSDSEWRARCTPFHIRALQDLGPSRIYSDGRIALTTRYDSKHHDFGTCHYMGRRGDLAYGCGGRRYVPKVVPFVRRAITDQAWKDLESLHMQSATLKGLYANLALYGKEDHLIPDEAQWAYDQAWELLESMAATTRIWPQAWNLDKLSSAAGPGLGLRKQGFKTKGDWVNHLYNVSDTLLDDTTPGPYPVRCGSRGRLIDSRDKDATDPVKEGRLVWEIDARDIVRLDRYARPLNEWLAENTACGSVIGMGSLAKHTQEYWRVLGLGAGAEAPALQVPTTAKLACLDRRRYDSSIRRRHWARALQLVRVLFGEVEAEHDPFWEYVLRSICGNLLVMPDGAIYSPIHGGSSGNPFIQPLETMITFVFTLADLALFREKVDGFRPKMSSVYGWYPTLALGDDQVTSDYIVGDLPSLEYFAQAEDEYWGTEISVGKSWSGRVDEKIIPPEINAPPLGPRFLGNYIIAGLPWRPLSELLVKLVHPEYAGGTWTEELIRLASYRMAWWTNHAARQILEGLIYDIMNYSAYEDFSDLPAYWSRERTKWEHPALEHVNPLQLLCDPLTNWDYLYPARNFDGQTDLAKAETQKFLRPGQLTYS